MSENPYSGGYEGDVVGEERTSALAITSLILSLTCCLSPVGLILGIVSLVTIKGSGGRVGGTGMAIAAIVVGLILSVVLAAGAIGASQANKLFSEMGFGGAAAVLEALEADDFDGARARLATPLDTVTDADLEAFRDAYRGVTGAYQGVPESLFDSFEQYAQVQGSMQNYQGQQNIVPIPGTFDQGVFLVVAFIEPTQSGPTTPGGLPMPLLRDLVVVLPDGSEARLSDFRGPTAIAAPSGAEADPDADPATDPAADDEP